jgi:hypothetical protein
MRESPQSEHEEPEMTDGRNEFCILAVAMSLAGEIRIDVATARGSPRRQWSRRPQFASHEQVSIELSACTP